MVNIMSLNESVAKSLFKHTEVVLLISGVVFLSASVIEELPSSSNAWKIIFRQSPNVLVLIIGILQWLAALALVLVSTLSSKSPVASRSATVRSEILKLKLPHGLAINHTTENIDPEQVISNFQGLSTTQKAIIGKFYETKKTEMAVDDLFDIFHKSHPGIIETKDELYFRAMDLYHAGLIGVSKTGEKTTLLVWLPKVGKILVDNDYLRSP